MDPPAAECMGNITASVYGNAIIIEKRRLGGVTFFLPVEVDTVQFTEIGKLFREPAIRNVYEGLIVPFPHVCMLLEIIVDSKDQRADIIRDTVIDDLPRRFGQIVVDTIVPLSSQCFLPGCGLFGSLWKTVSSADFR